MEIVFTIRNSACSWDLVKHGRCFRWMIHIGNGCPIYTNDFVGLDLFKRGTDDIPSVVSLIEPDALEVADAVKRGGWWSNAWASVVQSDTT